MSKTWQIIIVVCALAAGFLLSQGIKSCDGPDAVSDLERQVILIKERYDVLAKKDSLKDVKIAEMDKKDSVMYRSITINHQSDKNEKAHTNSVADNKLQAYTDSILRSDKGMR